MRVQHMSVAVLVATMVVTGPVHAEPESAESEAEERGNNRLLIKGLVAVIGETVEDGDREQGALGGFAIIYSRVLIEEWLQLEIAAPFLFGEEAFEAPLDIHLIKPWDIGDWELFVGTGLSFSARFPWKGPREGTEEENDDFNLVPGITSVVGFIWWFRPHTGLTVSFDINFYPEEGRELEFSPGTGFTIAF